MPRQDRMWGCRVLSQRGKARNSLPARRELWRAGVPLDGSPHLWFGHRLDRR
jgi:hypothetical protein